MIYLLRENWADGKETYVLVSETANISTFCFIIHDKFSNVFLMEFTFRYDSIPLWELIKQSPLRIWEISVLVVNKYINK